MADAMRCAVSEYPQIQMCSGDPSQSLDSLGEALFGMARAWSCIGLGCSH